MVDLTVQLHHLFQLDHRPLEISRITQQRRDVEPGHGLTSAVADLPADAQRTVVVVQCGVVVTPGPVD